MKKLRKIEPVEFDPETGEMVFNPDADAANADWIRAARLKRKADQGDMEAKKQLDELFNTPMYEISEEEEPEE
jgi:hypothetical protein